MPPLRAQRFNWVPRSVGLRPRLLTAAASRLRKCRGVVRVAASAQGEPGPRGSKRPWPRAALPACAPRGQPAPGAGQRPGSHGRMNRCRPQRGATRQPRVTPWGHVPQETDEGPKGHDPTLRTPRRRRSIGPSGLVGIIKYAPVTQASDLGYRVTLLRSRNAVPLSQILRPRTQFLRNRI